MSVQYCFVDVITMEIKNKWCAGIFAMKNTIINKYNKL